MNGFGATGEFALGEDADDVTAVFGAMQASVAAVAGAVSVYIDIAAQMQAGGPDLVNDLEVYIDAAGVLNADECALVVEVEAHINASVTLEGGLATLIAQALVVDRRIMTWGQKTRLDRLRRTEIDD